MKNILELIKLSGRVEADEEDPLPSERFLDCSAVLRWLAIGLRSGHSNAIVAWSRLYDRKGEMGLDVSSLSFNNQRNS